jgi:hypothetical protein
MVRETNTVHIPCKSYGIVTLLYAMKANEEIEVYLHLFLSSTLDWGVCNAAALCSVVSAKTTSAMLGPDSKLFFFLACKRKHLFKTTRPRIQRFCKFIAAQTLCLSTLVTLAARSWTSQILESLVQIPLGGKRLYPRVA